MGESVEDGGDVAGPGPVPGGAEDSPTAGGGELSGRGEQPESQAAGSQSRVLPVSASIGIQASRVERDPDGLEPDVVLGGVMQGQVPQPSGPGGPDPVLCAGPEAVAEFEVGDWPAGGVGGEAGEPQAVRVGDPQPGPWVRPKRWRTERPTGLPCRQSDLG